MKNLCFPLLVNFIASNRKLPKHWFFTLYVNDVQPNNFDDILICILLLRRVIQQRSTQKSKMQIHWHLSCLCAIRSLSLSSLAWCGFPCCDVAVKLQNTRRELRCDHFHHSAPRGVCSVDASASLQCFDKVYGEWFATNMLHAFNKTDKNLDNGKRLTYKRIRYFTLTQLAVLL